MDIYLLFSALKSYFGDLCIELYLLICFGAVKGSPWGVIGTSKKENSQISISYGKDGRCHTSTC
jgi:hypothetical protein